MQGQLQTRERQVKKLQDKADTHLGKVKELENASDLLIKEISSMREEDGRIR